MEKFFINNREGKKIVVIVECPEQPSGLAFVMHGLGGFKEQPHVEAMAKSCLDHGYTTVRFDTTNTFGESEGDYADATVTNYYSDLEDVIGWAKTQNWYQEPFILTGHSLGGLSTALYAERHPQEVKALAPISTVVSGSLTLETDEYRRVLPEWKRTGWRISERHSKLGTMKRLKYSYVDDVVKYDLLPEARKLTMPVLLIVGEDDTSTPWRYQEMFFQALPGPKELHVIKNAPHTFCRPKELEELARLFNAWFDSLK